MESDWRADLDEYFAKLDNDPSYGTTRKAQENARNEQFFVLIAVPAFEEIKKELEKHRRQVTVGRSADHVSIKVVYQDHIEFDYALLLRGRRVYPIKTISEGDNTSNAEGSLRSDSQDYTVLDLTMTELIQHCLKAYKDCRRKAAWGTRSYGRQ